MDWPGIDLEDPSAVAFCLSCEARFERPLTRCSACGGPMLGRDEIMSRLRQSAGGRPDPGPPGRLALVCRALSTDRAAEVRSRLQATGAPFLEAENLAGGGEAGDASPVVDFFLGEADLDWARGVMPGLTEEGLLIRPVPDDAGPVSLNALRFDLADVSAVAWCRSCGTAYRRPLERCGLCGGSVLSRGMIESRLAATVTGSEPRNLPGALKWLCRIHKGGEEGALQKGLRDGEVPYLELELSADDAEAAAELPWVDIFVGEEDEEWVWETLGEVVERGPAVQVAVASGEVEAASIRSRLDAAGIAYTENREVRPLAISLGPMGRDHFFVLEMDLERAREALSEEPPEVGDFTADTDDKPE